LPQHRHGGGHLWSCCRVLEGEDRAKCRRPAGIPATIMTHYRKLIIGGDIMFVVNKIPFFMTISRHIKFGTVEMLKNQQSATILAAIKQVKSIYMKHGFVLDHMLMDGQFEPLQAALADLQITLNTVSNDKHMPKIEWHIQTSK
jgi:hypothetical protein